MKALSKYNSKPIQTYILPLILVVSTLVFSFVTAEFGFKGGIIGIFLVVGIAAGIYTFMTPAFGLYAVTIFSFMFFYIGRNVQIEGFGFLIEIVVYASCFGIIMKKKREGEAIFSQSWHIISIFLIIILIYTILEFGNPNAHSQSGNLIVLRGMMRDLGVCFLMVHVFNSYRDISRYFRMFIILSVLSALYGCYQEWHGFSMKEIEWMNSNPMYIKLYVLNTGVIRRFSTLSDPTTFGITAGIGALFCMAMMLTTKSYKIKTFHFIAIIIQLMGMSYSGTRTATFVFTMGVVFYVVMNINNRNTLLFTCIFGSLFAFLVYGPIYGNSTINRLRSSFEIKKDASMNVRDENRKRIQPYIYSHPFGGGLATVGDNGQEYNPGHPLAGFPPDSGMLAIALETGWVGLILSCTMYFIMMRVGIKAYYRIRKKMARKYLLAALLIIFGFILCQYAQQSISQIPECFLFYGAVAIVMKVPKFESKRNETYIT